MPTYETLLVSIDGPVARITVNRPEKLNALNATVMTELVAAVHAVEADPSVRVAIVNGAGERAFVAGADIAQMATLNSEEARAFSALGHRVGDALEGSRLPFIAQVHGFALGGGCELALACDLIYAGDKAKFGQPEAGLGVIPGFGGTQRLKRRVGVGKARELLFRANVIDAAAAERIGLVDGVFASDVLTAEVTKIAHEIAKNAPLAVAQAKRVMRAGQDVPLAVAHEIEQQGFGVLFGTSDQKSAMTAFVSDPKKPRTFEGR